ncbi:hypothetical protein GCM10027026_34380 [Myroides odoratimimus subsp. xuanwuensis]
MEFALVVPLLLVLLFGIIGYGYMLSFRQALSQGAAEAARAAAVAPLAAQRQGKAEAALQEALSSYGVTCTAGSLRHGADGAGVCTVTLGPCANDASQDCAHVVLDYTYADDPLLPKLPGVPLPESLRYEAVARVS